MNIRSTMTTLCVACLLSGMSLTARSETQTQLSPNDITALTATSSRSLAGIHDPSIVQAGSQYYIMGTHRGFARSADLMNWNGLTMNFGLVGADGSVSSCAPAQAFSTQQVRKVKALVNGQVREVEFQNFDAQAWAYGDAASYDISGNMWAPDIIYNPTMKKWCMYMSVNGDTWHSSIVLLTSSTIEGRYVYQGPVSISGFRDDVTPQVSWKKTDLELVIGEQANLPARYNRGNGWGSHWPNNIDPCVFYDADSTLWMSYGSWSGGIYIIKLDAETGLRDYTVTYPLTPSSGDHASSDPYYGTHIAGGYYVSGEGSYIQRIGDYYYLFMSYGGLEAKGGYVMRMFRSQNPDGPYVDSQGVSAVFDRYQLNFGPGAATNRGHLLMSAYKDWGFQGAGEGRVAQGHNSAFVDDKGRAFVVYHTRYNNGTEWFSDRVHQLFQNDQGWLVCAPFQYDGETLTDEDIRKGCLFTDEQLAGQYSLMLHRYQLDQKELEAVTPVTVRFETDGKVTGGMTGTWKRLEGTGYVVLVLDGKAYRGVITEQTIEGSVAKAISISALCAATGQPVWAYKMEPQYAVAYTAKAYTIPIKDNASISRNVELYGDGLYGARIEWLSSEPSVITNTGKYIAPDATTDVTLTCRISAENYCYDRQFTVKAAKNNVPESTLTTLLTPLAAYYDFDDETLANSYDAAQTMSMQKSGAGVKPALETDVARDGQVAHLFGGKASSDLSYLYFPNPLAGLDNIEGFTVSFWLKRADDNLNAALWSITDKRANLATVRQRLFFTGNAYVGFNNGTDYFDINRPGEGYNAGTGLIGVGQWAFVSLTCDAEGVSIFVDGSKKTFKSFESSAGESTTISKTAALFDYQKVLDMVTAAEFMQLGVGNRGVASAEAWYDNLLVHARALSSVDERNLYTLACRVTDYSQGIGTGIAVPMAGDARSRAGRTDVYDLGGYRVRPSVSTQNSSLKPGLYIVNGRKVLLR